MFTRKHLREALRGAQTLTGRQIARLMSMSKLKWANGNLATKRGGEFHYCAMGQIAKLAGFDELTILQTGSTVKSIYRTNDYTLNKEQCIAAFCAQGDETHNVASWMARLKHNESQRKG